MHVYENTYLISYRYSDLRLLFKFSSVESEPYYSGSGSVLIYPYGRSSRLTN